MANLSITKRALAQTLKELMLEEPLAKISIGDICTHCGMNRKSFYYHFKDKYDLVNWIFDTEFLQCYVGEASAEDGGWEAMLRLCEYFQKNKAFYQRALESQGQNSFYEYFGDILTVIISENLHPLFEDGEHHEFYITLFTEAIRSVIVRWLREERSLPPEEFVQLLKNATMGIGYKA